MTGPAGQASRLPPLLARARAVHAALAGRGPSARAWLGERRRNLPQLLLALLFLYLYNRALHSGGPIHAAAAVLAAALFLTTLFVLEVGIGAIVLAMLLSPEIAIGTAGSRDLVVRLEDLLIPLVGVAWMARKALGLERRELRRDLIFVPMALFLAVQILATLRGTAYFRIEASAAAFHILKQVEYFAIFFFALQYVDSARKSVTLLALALVTALVLAAYNLLLIPSTALGTRRRLTAPFEGATPEPSSIGGYFVIAMALVLAFLVAAPPGSLRRWLLVLFAVLFLPFLWTLSRTSYAAFLGVLVVLIWVSRSRPLFFTFLAGLLASPILLPGAVIERVLSTVRNSDRIFGWFDRSFAERLWIWYKVQFGLRRHPLLGRGVTAENVLDSYYARVLIESGLLGLGLFLLIAWRLLRLARRVRRTHPEWWARAFAMGYTAALAGLLLHAFSAITFVIVRIMEPFWLLSGILVSLAADLAETPSRTGPEPAPSPPTVLRRNLAHG